MTAIDEKGIAAWKSCGDFAGEGRGHVRGWGEAATRGADAAQAGFERHMVRRIFARNIEEG